MKLPLLPALLCVFPLAARAGFADISVENIRSSGGFHHRNISDVAATAYTDTDSVNLGTEGRRFDFAHQCAIEITFREVGAVPRPGEYKVEWFFFSKGVNDQSRTVFDSGSEPVVRGDQIIDASSRSVGERREVHTTTSLAGTEADQMGNVPVTVSTSRSRSGEKIEGWVVRLRQNGNVVRTLASLSELKDLAQSPEGHKILDTLSP